jgi:hypothetical protein
MLALALLLAAATPVRADTASKARSVAVKVLRGKTVPIRGGINALAVGYDPATRFSLHGEAGLAWGTTNSGLLGKTSVHHVTLLPRMSIAAGDDREFASSAAVTIGHTWSRGLAFGIEGGADLQLFGGVAFGPLAKVRFGVGPVALYVMNWVHLGDETDVGVSLGLELFRLPSLSAFERARYAAEVAAE